MKEKTKLFISKWAKKKRTWFILGFVIIILAIIFLKPSSSAKNTVTDFVKYTDLKETVLATGQVISNVDLNLSFNTSGTVKSINVKVGDKVRAGQVLASLDSGSSLATLTSARGALAAANARYRKIVEGASNEEIALSQVILDQTKLTQETLIKNAYNNLLNSSPEAVPDDGRSDSIAPVITGTYNLGKEGEILLNSYSSSGGVSFNISGLVVGTVLADAVTPQAIGNSGLFIQFPQGSNDASTDWIIEIPNKKAANYLANYNTYQATLAQAKSAIDQREAELALKKAEARPADIELANADIISAQGQVQRAEAEYNNTIIKAPTDGTITSIDIKIGELASAMKEAIILQDVENIYLEANINEANIANLSAGMPIDVTYDAFGTEKIFSGNISKIDPSSTLVSGVVNYKITASVEKVENIRPGMTANMTIKVREKDHVLVIPSRAIILDKDGSENVRLITNTKNKKYKEVPVTTGLNGDGGLVEVVSGLNEGEEIVVLIKK